MEWRKVQGGYNAIPYRVRWVNGGRYVARVDQGMRMPTHLGTYDSAKEAMAACIGHARGEEAESAGWGEK